MYPRLKLTLTVVAAMIGGAFLAPNAAKAPEPAKIGFVDMERVESKHTRNFAAREKLAEEAKEAGKGFRDRQTEVKRKMREDLQLFQPGTPEHNRMFLDLKTEEHKIKLEQQMALGSFSDRRVALEEAFYAEVTAKAEAFAKKNGYDVIQLTRKLPRVKQDVDLIMLRNQWVVYRDAKLDVTDAFIEWVNK